MRTKSRITVLLLLTVVMLAGVVFVASAHHTADPNGHLAAVGPVSPEHGFPVWYQDGNGMTLELCLTDTANCLLPFAPPYSFPDNFPDEAFYFSAVSMMPTGGGGSADIGLDLEAAFLNGGVVDGEQMVFGRIRIRIDDLMVDETYHVTHPYGTNSFVAEANRCDANGQNCVRGINFTEDIGNMAAGPNFGEALNSRIGPFLTWDTYPGDAAIPAGYIGDPAIEHAVVGSPFDTNFFRVEGPAGSFPASPNQCTDPALGADPQATDDCIENSGFFLMGKLSAIAGVQPTRATYMRDATGGVIDVVALSQPGQVLHVDAANLSQTAMRGDDAGNYYARLDFSDGGAPPELTVSNPGDLPPTEALITPVDQVIVTQAVFDADTQTLTVGALSSDQLAPPALTVYREDGVTVLGVMTNTTSVSLSGIVVPPASVVVKSSAGGADTEQVQISGAVFPAVSLVAIAGADQSVPQGAQVILDGTNSAGDIGSYTWTQTDGPPVTLANADAAVASFTAGEAGSVYTFRLTVDDYPDAQPPSSDEVTVTVEDITAPVANAGPDQGPDQTVVQGASITLDGSASTGATSFAWTQTNGTAVTNLQGETSVAVSFELADANPVEFRLDVSGPGGGPVSDSVVITPLQDTITVVAAQYRRNKNQWDIRGTTTVLGAPAGLGNTVFIYRDATLTDLIGEVDVDNLGDWRLRDSLDGPDAGNQIYVVSSRGGSTQFTASVRN